MVTSRLRMQLANAFLIAMCIWPAVHFVMVKRYDHDPWHGAGWAMYLAPHGAATVHLVQRDGSVLPGEIVAMRALASIARRASVQGRLYDPNADMERLLAEVPAGLVDGLYLRLTLLRFDGWSGQLGPREVLYEAEAASAVPRDVSQSPYVAVQVPAAGTWRSESEGIELTVSDRVVETGGNVPRTDSQGCGDFPGCLADGAGSYVALYAEGNRAWLADCGGPEATRYYRTQLDQDWAEDGLVVVWRSMLTTCTVRNDAPSWSRQ